MIVFIYSISILCGMFLIGCANYDYNTTNGIYQHKVEDFLEYFQNVKHLSNEELHKEYKEVKYAYSKESNRSNALKFSLLLIISDSKIENKYQAIELLEDVIKHTENNSIRNFALLLRDILLERQKKEMLYKIISKKLDKIIEEKRNQEIMQEMTTRKLNSIVKEKKQRDIQYQKIYKKLNEKEQIVEILQKKIEELKAIERSINERKNTQAPTT